MGSRGGGLVSPLPAATFAPPRGVLAPQATPATGVVAAQQRQAAAQHEGTPGQAVPFDVLLRSQQQQQQQQPTPNPPSVLPLVTPKAAAQDTPPTGPESAAAAAAGAPPALAGPRGPVGGGMFRLTPAGRGRGSGSSSSSKAPGERSMGRILVGPSGAQAVLPRQAGTRQPPAAVDPSPMDPFSPGPTARPARVPVPVSCCHVTQRRLAPICQPWSRPCRPYSSSRPRLPLLPRTRFPPLWAPISSRSCPSPPLCTWARTRGRPAPASSACSASSPS